jgi:hypothetical protein
MYCHYINILARLFGQSFPKVEGVDYINSNSVTVILLDLTIVQREGSIGNHDTCIRFNKGVLCGQPLA